MTTVYALASPAPTVYAFPAQIHPSSTVAGGGFIGPVYAPTRTGRVYRDRGRLRYRVTVSGRATVQSRGLLAVELERTARPALLAAGARFTYSTATTTTAAIRGQTQAVAAATRTTVGVADHRYLSLSPVVFDLLLESWDD